MLLLPTSLMYYAMNKERIYCESLLAVLGGIREPNIGHEEEAVLDLCRDEINKWMISQTREERSVDLTRHGIDNIDLVVKMCGDFGLLGLRAILVSQLTGMWTAFETLAGDLWEMALNVHPYGLSELKGKPSDRISKNSKKK